MMKTEEKVCFLMPGIDGSTIGPCSIDSKDLKKILKAAKELVGDIYGVMPFAFYISTQLNAGTLKDEEGNEFETLPKLVGTSGLYHIAGTLRKKSEVTNSTLLFNMNQFSWNVICISNNGQTTPFRREDFLINMDGEIIERGDDPKWEIPAKA